MYDAIVGRLSAQVQKEIEEHCRECAECRADLESLTAVVDALPRRTTEPSEERDGLFWASFAERVDARIEGASRHRARFWAPWLEEIETLLTRSWKPVGAAAGILALALIGFVLSQRGPVPTTDGPPAPSATADVTPDTTGERFARYLRKSNALLVGLANKKIDDDVVDLSAERDLSRQLVRESRALRGKPLDPQAVRLMGDMEKILIEIASRNETTDRDHFDLIRNGIRQENLLFKVRMTETAYQTQTASYERVR